MSTLDAALSAVCTASAMIAIAHRTPASEADAFASFADMEAASLPLADALRELATAPRPSTALRARADRRLQRSARGYRARQIARIAADDAAAQINDYLNGDFR
jgi:hypothetical protein